jgi:hypothetical protein
MSSYSASIGKLYDRLTLKVKELDEKLIQEYDPSISKIEKLRYDFFKKCVSEKHTPA